MPGINVIVPAQWKNKIMCSDRDAFEQGAAELPLKANLAIPDGTPVNIAATGVVIEMVATSAVPNGLALGDCVGGATDGAELGVVMEMRVGDKFYGILTEAVPMNWHTQVVGLLKGSGTEGYKFVISGFAVGSNLFTISGLKDAKVGDTNALIEVKKTS